MTHRPADRRSAGALEKASAEVRRGKVVSFLSPLLLAALLLLLAAPCRAQPTNEAAYQALAIRCLAAAIDTARVLLLDAPVEMPYLRTALVQHWQQEDRVLFLPDSTRRLPEPPPTRLAYTPEEARVTYARENGRLRRTVTLALRYTLTASDGRLLREDQCRETFTDVLPSDAVSAVESPAFPETQGARPEGSWLRRYLDPAVLLVATATGIYLFFALRSDD